ncbi:unnamed protein product [Miscanthus lutarioriparius]|uniref:Uncharacterized protein n=1 Tax=Miscanthus lutarioriparius TaxID=422564 RepID=A0A811N3I0_9POAL|nr:unnamed protein product [Miscanthus lutarioriparius]
MPPEPAGYAPLGAVERQRRRALFLQSYQFSVERRQGPAERLGLGLGGRLARRLREVGGAVARAAAAGWWVGAGLARAWRGWRPRADPLLGCFGSAAPAHHHLHDYA